MTIAEYIEHLKKYPQDTRVLNFNSGLPTEKDPDIGDYNAVDGTITLW